MNVFLSKFLSSVIARAQSLAVADFVFTRMSVNKLKCTSCNIVISEVLAFIRDRHHVVDNESLIRICETAFSEEEIDEAKKLLFVSTKTTKKLVSRRKNKKQKDLEDMITVFKTLDPEQIPLFVAYELHKLPPVCFDHVDVTKLLKDILVLRKDVEDIKNNYVTNLQLEELKLKVNNSENTSPLINSNVNVNVKRGGYLLDSGPFGLPHIEQQPVNNVEVPRSSHNDVSHDSASVIPTSMYRTLVHTQDEGDTRTKPVSPAPVNSTMLKNDSVVPLDDVCKQQTLAEIVKKGEWKENKPDEQWILVQRSKPRNRFVGMTGKALSNSANFKAAEIKIPVFISNVNKAATEKDISEYIEQKTKEVVKLEKINMKSERQYNAFKLFIPKHRLNIFMDDTFWPEGITFRRFINFKRIKDPDIVNNDPIDCS